MTTRKSFSKKSARVYVLALMFALTTAFTQPAFAAETVDLSAQTSVPAMQTAIQTAINTASGTDGMVTVTGAYSGHVYYDNVNLDIPANVTVRWEGVFHHNMLPSKSLISLNGSGTFEVATDGSLQTTHPASGAAIGTGINDGGYGFTLKVSGGAVFSENYSAINVYCNVEISGGVITSNAPATSITYAFTHYSM